MKEHRRLGRRPRRTTERKRPARGKEAAVEATMDESTMEVREEPIAEDIGDEPTREALDGVVESLLFASGAPLPMRRLVDVLDGPGVKEIKASLARLMAEYNRPQRGIHLLAV